ncbi:membrane protein [Streptococcus equi subsp. zooepidemicus Sz35]|uniref:TMEM164-related integral membrane acyltransferase n=1 Tax=Streptococcus equi TaxID=1336 RepID=UPI0005C3255F|nr:TIGR02206 family membrane protein [Streptococcus equi]KIS20907.1 membrane protein [Streptococcus equi subsp. zooepidemicus Sz35]MCD3403510.1 TIGR02206 family membrane protein [Streptococcus equi subsp. zooepidemicus]MCD3404195.1 TIGR02206 family membrane protein [Streptococcus equi subsp. zooepidemicus]HEL0658684.1 TIGR02206 family membrane protein [Streptococcus equi subsp. zooepidemicus]HEL0754182.1 TIGR02206 family membrane protein [Streptococcus equi subsp. zooepidemicus]
MNFFAIEPIGLPHVSLLFYLLSVMIAPFLVFMTLQLYQLKSYRYTFLGLQLVQLIGLYTWYALRGFPLTEALPLYHCRMAMLAVFFLPDRSSLKQLFMVLGIGGTFLALLSPDLYPYQLWHVANISFYLGHYALLVNGLVYLLRFYNPSQLKPVLVCRYLATINFALVLVNLATKGNYGFVMDIPIIHTHHLLLNFVIVTMGLTGLIKLIELIYVRFSEDNQLELKLSKER